jgi:His-Xaa-Ser system radical SAM maturase HxsC
MYSGEPLKTAKTSIGILTDSDEVVPRGNYILYKDSPNITDFGFKGYIVKTKKIPIFSKSGVRIDSNMNISQHLGDIVKISKEGEIHILWERDSTQNALFLTDSCNLNCLMCPQPQKPHDKKHIETANRILDLLNNKTVSHICITGGEPTLVKKDFLRILTRCSSEHPKSYLDILTNGQTLHDFDFAKECALKSSSGTCFCLSMHGDTPITHDKIVQNDGAFRNVHSSLYNLSKLNVEIEIRFVISKMNYMRLPNLADFFFRTYPFVHHFAIMGLEMTGCAEKNHDRIWIDPTDYKEELDRFVLEAERRGLNFSIYNHQLCTLTERAWKYARQSISGWKKIYLKKCETCDIKDQCGGFFSTSKEIISSEIKPIHL